MIEITKELLERIRTDSDVYEIAKEMGVSAKDLDYAVSNHYAKETPCYNCKYIAYRTKCMFCSRGKEDLY
jgi:RNA polymerase subunit RPABC4/transcription elongation factor Spt4